MQNTESQTRGEIRTNAPAFLPPTFVGNKNICGRCGGPRDQHVFDSLCDMILVEDRVKNDGTERIITVESTTGEVQRRDGNNARWMRRSLLPAELR